MHSRACDAIWCWWSPAWARTDCWGQKPCNLVCLINSISVRDNCGLTDSQHYNYISNDRRSRHPLTPGDHWCCLRIVNSWPLMIRTPAGVSLGWCLLVEPDKDITENYGVLVGRTLADASDWSTNVLINPGSDVVVLPSFSFVGNLVPVSVVSIALLTWKRLSRVLTPPWEMRDELHSGTFYINTSTFFPSPGEPVTGRTMAVQHDIETNSA